MSDVPNSVWNETDASNTTAAPDGAPEGMAPSGVNDVLRAHQGAVKRWYNWTIPQTTGGTTLAYTLSYGVAPGALVDGMTHLVQFHAGNLAGATLNVNGLGACPLHYYQPSGWAVVPEGTITANMISRAAYHASSGAYRLLDVKPSPSSTAATSFLTVDATISVASTYVNGPTTGSIGEAGWVVELSANGVYLNGSGGNMTASMRINNGSADIADTSGAGATGFNISLSIAPVVVTLSGATTFTLQATDNVGGNVGVLKATGPAAGTNKATWITYKRLY
jgi:hypothetical protein